MEGDERPVDDAVLGGTLQSAGQSLVDIYLLDARLGVVLDGEGDCGEAEGFAEHPAHVLLSSY